MLGRAPRLTPSCFTSLLGALLHNARVANKTVAIRSGSSRLVRTDGLEQSRRSPTNLYKTMDDETQHHDILVGALFCRVDIAIHPKALIGVANEVSDQRN